MGKSCNPRPVSRDKRRRTTRYHLPHRGAAEQRRPPAQAAGGPAGPPLMLTAVVAAVARRRFQNPVVPWYSHSLFISPALSTAPCRNRTMALTRRPSCGSFDRRGCLAVLADSSFSLCRSDRAPVPLHRMGLWSRGPAAAVEQPVGKFRARDALLNAVRGGGDEQVLDVGCGHGLMLIGAAKRLSSGHATGIDIWQDVDQAL